jgi:hypothetical protein
MIRKQRRLASILTVIAFALNVADAQVAGSPPYTLEQSVIASGGGTSADGGGIFSLTGNAGQSVAGSYSASSTFTVRSGFFTAPPTVAPSAASVTVSGRVLTPAGGGLTNARVILIDSQGNSRTAVSSLAGFYRFADVLVGETYVLTVSSKRYQFDSQIVTVMEEIDGLNFSALP